MRLTVYADYALRVLMYLAVKQDGRRKKRINSCRSHCKGGTAHVKPASSRMPW